MVPEGAKLFTIFESCTDMFPEPMLNAPPAFKALLLVMVDSVDRKSVV